MYTYDWADLTHMSAEVPILSNYLTLPVIAKKLATYSRLRFTLNMRVLVNGLPQQFGSCMVSWQPLTRAMGGGEGSYAPPLLARLYPATVGSGYDLCQLSQAPLAGMIYPQNNTELCFSQKFIYPLEWLDPTNATDYGCLIFRTVQTLKTIQTSNTPVRITVLAWLTDVELSGSGFQYQSGTLEGMSHDLSRLGMHQTAAALGAAGKVAKLIGCTNIPSDQPITTTIPRIMPDIGSSEARVPVDVHTASSTQQLDTEPELSGFETIDEMNIDYMCQRESYLGNSSIAIGATGRVFSAYVSPILCQIQRVAAPFTHFRICNTMLSGVANHFQYWRGDIKFRIVAVASQYHRGKLRISYDPSPGSDSTTIRPEGLVKSVMLDLSEATEIEITVPFNNNRAYAAVPTLTDPLVFNDTDLMPWAVGATAPGRPYDNKFFNGLLMVDVLQPIASTSVQGIYLQIFVSGSNMEFARPVISDTATVYTNVEPFVYQSGEGSIEPLTQDSQVFLTETSPEQTGKIGENIVSARELIHKSMFFTVLVPPLTSGSTASRCIVWSKYPAIPAHSGYCYNGLGYHTSAVTAGRWNYVADTFVTVFRNFYLAQRGCYRYKFMPRKTIENMTVTSDFSLQVSGPLVNPIVAGSSAAAYDNMTFRSESGFGSSYIGPGEGCSLELGYPYVDKFLPTNSYERFTISSSIRRNITGDTYESFTFITTTLGTGVPEVETYVSGAPNLRFYCLMRAPVLIMTFGRPPTPLLTV